MLQVINLTGGELEWMCNHLGHEVSIDKEHYRRHPGVIELAKVSRVLIAIDQGELGQFSGKSLDEITVSG